MRLTVTLVLIVSVVNCYGHYTYEYLPAPGQYLTPYHYVIHHSQSLVPPVVYQPEEPPVVQEHDISVSRETLEDQSEEHNGLDISDEQASLHPDDAQVPEVQVHQKPVLPPVPRAYPKPIPLPIPHVPSGPNPGPAGDAPNVVFNGPQPDGSYDFSYDLGDQSRSEKSDADGNVQGTYTYTAAGGKKVTITYSAGAHKGFIPEGQGLLPPPPADCSEDEEPSGGSEQPGGSQIPQEPQQPEIPEEDDQQHIPPVIPPNEHGNEGGHKGMPYSYNYDAGLSSKTETADDNGHVQGSYTYVDGAGVKRTVKYTVNGDEGFVATGDIHPDPGTGEAETNSHGISSTAPPLTHGRDNDVNVGIKGGHGTKTPHHPRQPPPTNETPGGHGIKTPNRPPPPSDETPGGHGIKTPNRPPLPSDETPGGHGVKTPKRPPVGTKGALPKGGSGWDKYPLGG